MVSVYVSKIRRRVMFNPIYLFVQLQSVHVLTFNQDIGRIFSIRLLSFSRPLCVLMCWDLLGTRSVTQTLRRDPGNKEEEYKWQIINWWKNKQSLRVSSRWISLSPFEFVQFRWGTIVGPPYTPLELDLSFFVHHNNLTAFSLTPNFISDLLMTYIKTFNRRL